MAHTPSHAEIITNAANPAGLSLEPTPIAVSTTHGSTATARTYQAPRSGGLRQRSANQFLVIANGALKKIGDNTLYNNPISFAVNPAKPGDRSTHFWQMLLLALLHPCVVIL
jgi:hypothetical protein